MPRIKPNSIEELRQRINLADVIEPYVALKRSGNSFKGLSPFTQEKTPSFHVHPDKGFYKCFSSGNGGDLFKFIMQMENLDFPDAVEFIAGKFNIPLEYEDDGFAPEERSVRKQIFQIHEEAVSFYRACFLANNEHGRWIRNYWEHQRGFSKKLGETIGIGFAPVDSQKLLTHLQKKSFQGEALVKSGLFYGDNPQRLRPRFNGRLMIPIRDIQGRTIAFTARQTDLTPQTQDVEKSKYINSPETPIFIKKNMLFNLDRARVAAKDTGRFLLVEGQLDALRCYEQGIEHAVAPQGSGVSEDQIHLLKRYASGLDCLLDGDRAGRAAAMRVLPLALKNEIEIRFLPLPDGCDPDDLLREQGKAAFDAIEKNAQSAMTFAVQTLLPNPTQTSPAEKRQALQQLFEIVRTCPSSVLQDDYLSEISALALIDRSSLEHDIRQGEPRRTAQKITPKAQENHAEWLTSATDELLLIVLHHEEISSEVAKLIDLNWIPTQTTEGVLLSRFLADIREGLWPGIENIHELIEDDTENNLVYAWLARNPDYENPLEVANKALAALHKKYVEERIALKRNELLQAPDHAKAITAEIKELRAELNETPRLTPS